MTEKYLKQGFLDCCEFVGSNPGAGATFETDSLNTSSRNQFNLPL